jgi:hypothetical protein
MDGDTSIGPAETPEVKTQATVEGVDAQNANEFDLQHGLAGAEAKPFRANPKTADSSDPGTAKQKDEHPGGSTQPGDAPDQQDPNKRADLISERRNAGAEDTAGPAGRRQ